VKLCDTLREEHDYILIDCPAGIEQGFKNAIAGADRAIVVATPEVSSVRDADRIVGLLEASEIKNIRLILNRLRTDMIKRGEMMTIDDVVDILAIDVIGLVPDDESIVTSTNRGEPAVSDKNSRAGQAFRDVTKRIMGEEVPYMNLEETAGFRAWLRKTFRKGN